jgi:hypothetical protein
MKGHNDSFGHMGLRRGATAPKDVMVQNGDLWILYKRTRVHNQGRKILEDKERKNNSMILRQT